jgi:hypothetical protein
MILYRLSADVQTAEGMMESIQQWGGSVVPLKKDARSLIPVAFGPIIIDKFDLPGRDAVCSALNDRAEPDEEVISYDGELTEEDCDCGMHEGDEDEIADLLS